MAAEGKTPAAVSRKKEAAAKASTTAQPPLEGSSGTDGVESSSGTQDGDTGALEGGAGADNVESGGGAQGVDAGVVDGGAVDAGVLESVLIPAFPRLVAVVNDTPIPYVIAGKYVAGHASEHVVVNDEDEITRMESDCAQIMALNDTHQGAEVPALRVTEVE